jgi:hypothetical protein
MRFRIETSWEHYRICTEDVMAYKQGAMTTVKPFATNSLPMRKSMTWAIASPDFRSALPTPANEPQGAKAMGCPWFKGLSRVSDERARLAPFPLCPRSVRGGLSSPFRARPRRAT